MPWLSQAGAVLDAWYPGQSNGTALANVLFGQGRPERPPAGDVPDQPVPGPGGSIPAQFPGINGQVLYTEGIDVGYRWYDAQGTTPLFPFGYGLSYTQFGFSGLKVSPKRSDGVSDVTVSATITNTGKTAGADVAQLYLGDPASAGEPPRQLVGFKRVDLALGRVRTAAVHDHTARYLVVGSGRRWLDARAPAAMTSGWAIPRHWPTCRSTARSTSPTRRARGRWWSTPHA